MVEYTLGNSVTVTKNLREHIVEYLEEIEKLSDIKISDAQREELIKYIGKTDLSFIDSKNSREVFNKNKIQLQQDWKSNSSLDKWPEGHTAHHIIKLNYAGPNTWWNIFPIRYLSHNYLHGGYRHICYKIFECNNRTYSFEDAKIRINSIFNNLKEDELLNKINKDYKILTDAKCETIVEKYAKEISYYLELSLEKGYIELSKDILKNYGTSYSLMTDELVIKMLKVVNHDTYMDFIKEVDASILKKNVGILVSACKRKDNELVKYILKAGCPSFSSLYYENNVTIGECGNRVKRTIFDYACTSGDLGIVESFIRKGATFEDIDVTRRESIFGDLKEFPIIKSRLVSLRKKVTPDKELVRSVKTKWKNLFEKK